jgi:hypothetical protein
MQYQGVSYELMYGTGGHGGPHHSLEEATKQARMLLASCPSERTVYVVPRDVRPLHPDNAVRTVTRAGVTCR